MGKQRRKQLLHDSKGASLVLVLVAMMFVGIIASIVLTITVGNSKSTRTTQDSSQNFYYTESALDDLKLYLNKFATSIATDALLDTLAGSGTVKEGDHTLTDDELFNKLFSEKLGAALASFVSDTDITETVGTDKVFQEEFLKQYITFGRTGDIKISFDPVLEYVETTDESTGFVYKYPKLTNVKVTLLGDEDSGMTQGYETTITTDITFRASRPGIGKLLNTGSDFDYPIYRHVIIAGKDILPSNMSMVNDTFIGGLYSFGYFNAANELAVNPSDAPSVSIFSKDVVVGKDINVNKGELTFNPFDVYTSLLTTNEKKLDGVEGKIDTYSEIWCDSIKVGDATVNWAMAGRHKDSIYLRKNLVLNGNNAEFYGSGGNIIGYSNRESTNKTGTESNVAIYNTAEEPLSSAIILNGLGARLRLSELYTLSMAGQAYTALSSIDGVYDSYDSIPTSDTAGSTVTRSYFTQGESITYSPIQALYLIPGDCIPDVGHNPMTITEFNTLFEKSGAGSGTINNLASLRIAGYLDSPAYTASHSLRYIPGNSSSTIEESVYLFWNFKDTDSAVNYFNAVTGSVDGVENRYQGLLQKQVDMLEKYGGIIKIPLNSNIIGNGFIYTDSHYYPVKGKTSSASGLGLSTMVAYGTQRNNLVSSLGVETASDGTTSLIDTMFEWTGTGLAGTKANVTQNSYDLVGPLKNHTRATIQSDKSIVETLSVAEEDLGDLNVVIDHGTAQDTTTKYKLIVGDNVKLKSSDYDANTKYVVISPGNVEFTDDWNGKTFTGIIIAGGSVSIARNMTLQCMGVIPAHTEKCTYRNGESPLKTIEKPIEEMEEMEEFDALLRTVVDDTNLDDGNAILRSIFGIAENGLKPPTPSDDFVTLEMTDWDRNKG